MTNNFVRTRRGGGSIKGIIKGISSEGNYKEEKM